MDEVCSIPSCKGAPRDRSRGWPEARPKPVFSPPSWLVAGASALRGRPHHRGFVLPPPTAESGVSAPSTDARLAETSDPLKLPVHRASTAWASGPRHTRIADLVQVVPHPGRSASASSSNGDSSDQVTAIAAAAMWSSSGQRKLSAARSQNPPRTCPPAACCVPCLNGRRGRTQRHFIPFHHFTPRFSVSFCFP